MKIHPIAEMFPIGDVEELAKSISDNGYDKKHPVILYEDKILDGRTRWEACKRVGVEPPTIELPSGSDPYAFVWKENAVRRHLEAGQKAVLAVKFVHASDKWMSEQKEKRHEARSEAVSKSNRVRAGTAHSSRTGSGGSSREKPPKTERKPERHEHRRLASMSGTSPATAARALELEKKSPELFEQVAAGKLPLNKALGVTKLQAKTKLAEELRKNPPPPPQGPFGVIAIDPPWQYDKRAEDPLATRGRIEYPSMSTERLCELPVGQLADPKGCVLWLWTTNAFMRDAYRLLDAWGFEGKTILTWVKNKMGMGDWLRGKTEHCILAVRGKPIVMLTNQTTVLEANVREHSRKPDEFFSLVEKLVPDARRLEMFSREEREGWRMWGGETGKFEAAE